MTEKTRKPEQTQTATPELIPVSEYNNVFPYPKIGALRQLIFHDPDNFVEKVVRKIGKRLYIKVPAFFEWVEETNRKTV